MPAHIYIYMKGSCSKHLKEHMYVFGLFIYFPSFVLEGWVVTNTICKPFGLLQSLILMSYSKAEEPKL